MAAPLRGLSVEDPSKVGVSSFMDALSPQGVSPYTLFDREGWSRLRADAQMTLSADELEDLASLNEPMSLNEVETIYLPLSRLLRLYISATQELFYATQAFLASADTKVPYIIGMAGSVAVGKSTSARILRALLAGLPSKPKVALVTTDGFLLPNAVLQAEGLMEKKGFPESYDTKALLKFLSDIKTGLPKVEAPRYSHLVYDVILNERTIVESPDILIVEGLNVLQPARLPKDGKAIPFVSDYFDFSVYIDAEEAVIKEWYVNRFMRLRETAFRDPKSYFHRYSTISDEEAYETSLSIWERINGVNLRENILPTRQRADLILHKGANHAVEAVALRKL